MKNNKATEVKHISTTDAMALLGVKDSALSRFTKYHGIPSVKIGREVFYPEAILLEAFTSKSRAGSPSQEQRDVRTKYDKFFRVKGDVVIVADAHCPMVDWAFWETMLRHKDKHKIGQLILAGDTLDCSSFSKFPRIVEAPWQVERDVGKKLLTDAAKEFDKVYVLTANHEMRYIVRMFTSYDDKAADRDGGGLLDLWQVMVANMDNALQRKIVFSIYPYCYINSRWMVVHPASARKHPLSLGREISAVYNKSVIVTHAHMSAWSFAPNTEHQLIDCGCFADPVMFDYKNLRITSHYQWSESFVTISGHKASLILKDGTLPVSVGGAE